MNGHSANLHLPDFERRIGDRRNSPLMLLGWLLFTLLMMALAVWFMARQMPASEPIETSHSMAPATSEIGWLLERSERLGLTGEQIAALSSLDSRWRASRTALESKISLAAAAARERTRSARGERDISLGTMIAASYSYDSAAQDLGEQRHFYLSQAYSVLTPEQRKALESKAAR